MIGGKQLLVKEGQEVKADKLEAKKGDKLTIEEVLLLVDDNKTLIGTPYIEKAKVTAEVIDQVKGEKIRVATYKAKARYRKVKGFRAQLTQLKILKISPPSTPRKITKKV